MTPIAKMHNQGMTVEEIAASWEHISIAQVHAALAYYFANKVEVHAALEEEEREYERLAKQFPRQP